MGMVAPPFPWAASLVLLKDPGEMTLISETAIGRDLRQRRPRVQQLFLRARQAKAK